MTANENVLASLYMMLSMLGFVLNDLLVKSLQGSLPISQVIWIRGAMLSLILLGLIWHSGLLGQWRKALVPGLAFRAFFEGGATLLFLSALIHLPFANITAILQALPLVVTLGAALFLGEPVGWRRWLAITVGLAGVVLIIRPGMGGFHSASILVAVSVLFAAARDLVTRRLPADVPSLLVTGFSAFAVMCLGMVITLFNSNWTAMTFHQTGTLAIAAFFLFFGYHFIILAMRTGEIAYVVPYRYTSLLWAIGLAYLFFNEVPDTLTLTGSAIVVAMGLYTLFRELRASRMAKSNNR